MKRIIGLALIIAILGMVGLGYTEETSTAISGDYVYQLAEDGSAVILRYLGSDTTLNIPADIDGHPTGGIGDTAFMNNTILTSVTIPGTVSFIGKYAFYGCSSLNKVTVSSSTTHFYSTSFETGTGLFLQCKLSDDNTTEELDALQLQLNEQQDKLLAMEVLLNSQKEELARQQERIEALNSVKNKILKTLAASLSQANLNVSVDGSGAVVLDGSILFDAQSTITESGQDFLNRFLPVYLNVLLCVEHKDYVAEIVIEGHADSTGTYERNIGYAADRAEAVARYCLHVPGLNNEQKTLFESLLSVSSRSCADPVIVNGVEDKTASRRIVFKFNLRGTDMFLSESVTETSDESVIADVNAENNEPNEINDTCEEPGNVISDDANTNSVADGTTLSTIPDDDTFLIPLGDDINQTGYISIAMIHAPVSGYSFYYFSADGSVYNEQGKKVEYLKDIVSMYPTDPGVCLDKSGKVYILSLTGSYKYLKELENWNDISLIACSSTHAVGMRKDGTFVSAGDYRNKECDVDTWTNIIDIKAGENFTVGLKTDGTVVATGKNNYGQCNVSTWTDIVAIAVGDYHTVGLKANGTVVATGKDSKDQCFVGRWKNVDKIAAYRDYTVGITKEGEILITDSNHPALHKTENEWVGLPKDYRCPGALGILVNSWYVAVLGPDGIMHCWGFDRDNRIPKEPKTEYTQGECGGVALNYLKSRLKNPDSYQQHSITYTRDGDNYTVYIDYSAMNGFGGYTRSTFVCVVNCKTKSILSAYSY